MVFETRGASLPIQVPILVADKSCPSEVQQSQELVDWIPLSIMEVSDAAPGTAFTAVDPNSGHRVEIRLMPWLNTEESLSHFRRHLKLVDTLASNPRRVVRTELTERPARLVLEHDGKRLSSAIKIMSVSDRIASACAIWQAAAPAIKQGLYHGRLTSENIWLLRTGARSHIKVDYVSRFYSETTSKLEVDGEADCHALIEIICEMLAPIVDDENALAAFPSRERGQLKRLIRQALADIPSAVNPGADHQGIEQLDQWSQWFDACVHDPSKESYSPINTPDVPLPEHEESDPADTTAEVNIERLSTMLAAVDERTGAVEIAPVVNQVAAWTMPNCGERVGRFQLLEIIGQGGMGVVFRGVDLGTDKPVAVKILRPTGGDIAQAVRRFKKEARLLAGVQNEYVTQMIDAGYTNGLHFLVMEYVPGTNLKSWLQQHTYVDERAALRLIGDVARALVDAHQQEIVHRDIKPENVLLGWKQRESEYEPVTELDDFRVKLSDFGIARAMNQSASMEVTRAGTMLGTPAYMSPEQCKGMATVTPASDVYSLGITLYAMLTGQPPFMSEDPMKLAAMHCFDPPVALNRRNRQISEQTVELVNRMLAKDPAYRPSDAAQVVREIEKILRGGVCDMAVHPRLPTSSARALWEKIFQWRFESTPEQLWPYVSNTERINRAAGLQSVRYRTEKSADGGLRRFGTFRLAGIPISWEEHPFEWIEGRRMGVLREFATGPFRSFISIVELNPLPEGGTLLKHTVRIDPRSAFGRIIATIEAGWKGGRALDRIYRRINESIQHQRQNSLFDPFEASSLPSTTTDKRARQCVEKMIQKGVPAERAEELKSFILAAAPQALGQLKPFELADRLQLTIEECLDACLIAAHCGLLKLRWDILCPTCRAPASTADLLAQIGQHTNCEACDTEFATDVASAIELVFEAHPEIREIDVGQYCIGGPEHSPHVVTQLRMDPDERIELMVPLTAGDYILRITRSSQIQPLRARTQAAPSRLDLRLSQLGESNRMPVVRSGAVNLSLTNDFSGTQVVRLERTIDRKNVITAATASALPRFRELFPEQIFDRKAAIASDNLTLLAMRVSSIDDLYFHHGDAAAYQLLQTILEIMENCVISHQGSVIKSINELMVCSFRDCALSVRAALEVAERIAEKSELAGILTVAAIHRGPLLVTTQNGRLDYFGTTVRQVTTLCDQAQHGILLSDTVFTDPATQEMLHGPLGAHANRTFSVTLPGFKCHLVQHIISAQKN